MEGAEQRVEWFLNLCSKYNLKVLLDVHALKDSQNGFDNSGQARDVVWADDTHFTHWTQWTAHWLGT